MEQGYERELRFLCDTLRKCRVRVTEFSLSPSAVSQSFGDDSASSPFPAEDFGILHPNPEEISPRTVYKVCDRMHRRYLYFRISGGADPSALLIGPYLSEPVSPSRLLELAEAAGVPPKSQRYFDEYYASLPVLSEGNSLLIMLDTFCERLWDQPAFAIVDVDREPPTPASPINEVNRTDNFDGVMANMRAMEIRYELENEMMRAVSLGQLQKENQLISAFTEQAFEKRTSDPIRNLKNYFVIMNTLLRKAAESGGVHPVYLNNISTEFALKIEQMGSLSENAFLMREMFRSYCRLVRKHAMGKFSLLVQKVILLIDSDLSADLTLHTLAEHQKVSSGYLATVFKRETGKTVSEYIREKRIRHAAYLLATTHLQVQTVALHCGIVDVQYFSKIFKRQMGKTPKEYRESMSHGRNMAEKAM